MSAERFEDPPEKERALGKALSQGQTKTDGNDSLDQRSAGAQRPTLIIQGLGRRIARWRNRLARVVATPDFLFSPDLSLELDRLHVELEARRGRR